MKSLEGDTARQKKLLTNKGLIIILKLHTFFAAYAFSFMNHKLLRNLLVASLFVNLAGCIFFFGRRYYYSYYAPKHQKQERTSHISQFSVPVNGSDSIITYLFNRSQVDSTANRFFRMMPIQKGDIVFVGNSLIAGFPLQEMFHDIHIKNRGINGNTSKEVLLRIEDVIKGHPSVIYLEIGINDIGKSIPNDTILNNVKLTTQKIRSESPQTMLLVQSVFPTTQGSKKLEPLIEAFNRKLHGYCTAQNIPFVNLYPVFYKDGGLDDALTTDGVHFNGKGYFLWKKNIQKIIYTPAQSRPRHS